MNGRQKSIVRTSTVPFVQVHEIALGKSMFISHTKDMVMIHTKNIRIKENPIPIVINPFVEHALKKTLFYLCFLYSIIIIKESHFPLK